MNIPSLCVLALFLSQTVFAVVPARLQADLALNWKPEPEFGGFYEASEKGFYSAEGVDAAILPGGAGQPVAQMLASKKVKFGIVGADEVILARNNGAKIVAVFAVYQNDPQGFMVHPESGIKSLKEMFQTEGRVAMQRGYPYSLWLEKQYGPFKATIVPYTGGIAEFLRDKNYSQQCFVTSEPIAARRAKAESKTLLILESGFNPYLTVVAVHEDTLKKEPALVKKFLAATRKGWESYLKDPSKANRGMQKLNPGMDAGTFDEAAKLQAEFIETKETKKNGLGTMTAERWETIYGQLQELRLVKAGMKVSDFFANPPAK